MSSYLKRLQSAIFLGILFLGSAAVLQAQDEPAGDAAPAAEEAAPQVDSGDQAWMLVSCLLVLMMTAPGLALFYGGLVRNKNVLSTMMHSVFLMGLMSVIWFVYGYSMSFGEGNDFFGYPTAHFLLEGVGPEPGPYAGSISGQTFMLFQLMFAIITPALISGAYAERVKFSAMVIFTILWGTFVYFPLAHMTWGGGLFGWEAAIPAMDFAGGTVVHISSGVSALVFAFVLGRRLGYPGQPMPPHNLPLCVTGAALLWVGWFGFNAGSQLDASGGAANAFATTHFAAATAAVAWGCMEWCMRGKPSALGVASGIVAGLVAITPAAGFVTMGEAVIIGGIAGIVCNLAVSKLKAALKYDDSLDAFGVHGVGGTVGAILTGVFGEMSTDDMPTYTGWVKQTGNQIVAVLITAALAAVVTFVILKIVNATVGLRVSEQDETQGLDLSLHGERAYNS